jgi:hypothetical protein
MKKVFRFVLFFVCMYALFVSCSLDSGQWVPEENTDSGMEVTRASGNMLNLLTRNIVWAVSARNKTKRIYYEMRDRYPGAAIYGGTNFEPVNSFDEPFPGHYRVTPVYTGVKRYDYYYHEFWYKFYTVIEMDYESHLSQRWSTMSVYYYDENDDPYQNEYVSVWVC